MSVLAFSSIVGAISVLAGFPGALTGLASRNSTSELPGSR